MTDKQLAETFEQLRANYKEGWLVKDTEAFHKFCFANSDRISKLLLIAVKNSP
jgi:hypothetical protein